MNDLSKIIQPALLDSAKNTAIEIGKNEHLSDKQIQQVQVAYIKYLQDTMEGSYFKNLQENYINNFKITAKAVYTQQEVDAMIKFYSSPIGQQI